MRCYAAADLDRFCACFADDVLVLEPDGGVKARGIEAFRALYQRVFAENKDFAIELVSRMTLGPHCIDHERWQRTKRATGERVNGEVIIRHTVRGGKIAVVQMFRA